MSTTTDLRAWAEGNYATEAAVEMLIRAFDGRFAQVGNEWIRRGDNGGHWVDFEELFVQGTDGPYSAGEGRFLLAAASIGGVNNPVALHQVIEMGRAHQDLFLAALAHAAGSHHHSEMQTDMEGNIVGFLPIDSLHPWPALVV